MIRTISFFKFEGGEEADQQKEGQGVANSFPEISTHDTTEDISVESKFESLGNGGVDIDLGDDINDTDFEKF